MFKCLIVSNQNYLINALSSMEIFQDKILFNHISKSGENFDITIADYLIVAKNTHLLIADQRPINIKVLISELTNYIDKNFKKITFADISLDARTKILNNSKSVGGDSVNIIQLTETECKILNGLIIADNNFLTRKEIKTGILGYHESAETNTIENHIYHLRLKLNEINSKVIIDSFDNSYQLKI